MIMSYENLLSCLLIVKNLYQIHLIYATLYYPFLFLLIYASMSMAYLKFQCGLLEFPPL